MTLETKVYTADEFEAVIAHPDNADRHLELINGEIVEDMPTEEHSLIVANIYRVLYAFVTANRLGRVVFEVRRRVPNDDRNVRIPDLDYTSKVRLDAREGKVVTQEPVLQMPDLAVEVQSPGQSLKLMSDKAAYYLANGIHTVWLVYPAKRFVEVLTADDRQVLFESDTLTGGDLLPDFSMPIKAIFQTDDFS